MFAGFFWVCVSPLILKKKKHLPAHIDPENAYFFGKGDKLSSPFSYERKYNPRNRYYRSPATSPNPKMTTQWLKTQSAWTTTTVDSLPTPPPAYRSTSLRTLPSATDTTSLSSFIYTPRSAYEATHRKSTIPSIKISRSPTIPDSPPLFDLESHDGSNATFLRPDASPRELESPSIDHSPTVYLPVPSIAVMHENDDTNNSARIETDLASYDHATTSTDTRHSDVHTTLPDNSDPNLRIPTIEGLSQLLVDWGRQDDSATSIDRSNIGIAI